MLHIYNGILLSRKRRLNTAICNNIVFAKKLCTRSDAWAGMLSWWSCQSPVAHSYGLLNHPNSVCGAMFKLNAKFNADSLLYLLSHFECDSHTVHMFIQQCLLPPLTSTVKSSLFTHAHSSPLSRAARLHQCHTNHSCCINNGWTFSRQASYMFWLWVVGTQCNIQMMYHRFIHLKPI